MSGETDNISKIADKITDDIFNWFKWEKIPLTNENFICHKKDIHYTGKKEKAEHTHPVDVVYKYFDPYLNKNIFLNTDLKSYASDSINVASIRIALKSLARTIDCAKGSTVWKKKYIFDTDKEYEIRALLFIFNHDDGFSKDFRKLLRSVNFSSLPIQKNQILHTIEPETIRYLFTVTSDLESLHHSGSFPEKAYSFFYPELRLHRVHSNPDTLPATVEMLNSPYLIIRHNEVKKLDEEKDEVIATYNSGYVIYSRGRGENYKEFLYLLDTLSNYQLLNGRDKIRLRVVNPDPDTNIMSNFEKAKTLYISMWDFDDFKSKVISEIEFEVVNIKIPHYRPGEIGWNRK